MDACRAFRDRLVEVLREHPHASELSVLSWHTHLLECEACRGLLIAEEALEQLLASLPTPQLSAELAERVLARLEAFRQDDLRLDELLALDGSIAPPANLAAGVLAGLRARGPEQKLDRTLEQKLDRILNALPSPAVPEGLSERVLYALEGSRMNTSSSPGGGLLFGGHFGGLMAAAGLALLVGAAAWLWRPAGLPTELAWAEPPREFLEVLPVLENLELLKSDDLDFLLASAALGADDEWMETIDAWKESK